MYKIAVLVFGAILYFVSIEYFDHKKSFDQGAKVQVTIVKKYCRRKGGSQIDIDLNGKRSFVEVLASSCLELNIGQKIQVLQSETTGKFYWNKKPTGRVFYIYPFIIGLMIYCVYLDRK